MKILVVCQYYAPEPFRISDICEELVARGHEVKVLTGVPNYPMGYIYEDYKGGKRRKENINGVDVQRCFTVGRRHGAIWRFLNYYSFMFSSKNMVSKLDDDFDVVFVNQLSPVMMAEAGIKYSKAHKVPLLMYCLDLWPESLCTGGIRKGSAVYNVFHKISKRIYRSYDKILVASRGFENYLSGEFDIPQEKMGYLPQYAEELFGVTEPKAKDPEEAIDLLFAGNIGAAQRVDLIVRAAKKVIELGDCKVNWHIVGDGSELENCKKLANSLELTNVIFHGRHPLEKMPEFYAMADAMLLTLDKDEIISYTLPGKFQSYMAAGKPVLASADGETPRVIEDAKCGLCAVAGDENGLAEIVKSFGNMDKVEWATMAKNSRAYYDKNFTRTIFMDELERELLNSKLR